MQKSPRTSATSTGGGGSGGAEPDNHTPTLDILTIGQYLQPTPNHLPVDRFVTPETFNRFEAQGLARGFKVVESGPMVRSSYHADMQADALTDINARRKLEKLEHLIDASRDSRAS